MRWAVVHGWKTGRRFEFQDYEEAPTAEDALAAAHRRGIGWGNGYDPTYVGAEARLAPRGLDRDRHPTLFGLLVDGTAWCERGDEHGEWVGRAADGVVVALGMIGNEDGVERYLRAHPTPDTW